MRRIEGISRVQQLWWCSALIQDIHLVAALTGAFLAAIQTLFKLVPRLGLTSLGFLAPKIIHLLPFGCLKTLEDLDQFFKKWKVNAPTTIHIVSLANLLCRAWLPSLFRCETMLFRPLGYGHFSAHLDLPDMLLKVILRKWRKMMVPNLTKIAWYCQVSWTQSLISTRFHCALGLPWRRSQSASDSYSAIPFSPFRIDLSSRKWFIPPLKQSTQKARGRAYKILWRRKPDIKFYFTNRQDKNIKRMIHFS